MGQRASAACARVMAMSSKKDSGRSVPSSGRRCLSFHGSAGTRHQHRSERASRERSYARRRSRDARLEADAKGVDAWLTEDPTHVVKISSHRGPDK